MAAREQEFSRRAFSAFGVTVTVHSEDVALLDTLAELLPAAERDRGDVAVIHRIRPPGRVSPDRATASVAVNRVPVADGLDPDSVLEALADVVSDQIAARAAEHVFVRGGAVTLDGATILLPGGSFSGTTTLVAALDRRGATVLSDRYIVLDAEGRVHPFPRSEPLRRLLGAPAKDMPVAAKPGLIAALQYRPGAAGGPERLPASAGGMLLLGLVVEANRAPERALAATTAAATGATVLRGDRGEAEHAAEIVLENLPRR